MTIIRVESFYNAAFLCWKLRQETQSLVYDGGYNQIIPNLLNPESSLYEQDSHQILVLLADYNGILDAEYLYFDLSDGSKKRFLDAAYKACDRFISYIESYMNNVLTTRVLLVLPAISPYSLHGLLELNSPLAGIIHTLEILSEYITSKLQSFNRVAICSIDHIAREHGFKKLFDDRFFIASKSPFSTVGLDIVSRYISDVIDSIRLPRKKVIVCDLDNTLWGGVIGEDGIDGISLSRDQIGKCFRDFQFYLKCLSEKGFILAICSKNNYHDAIHAINNHPFQVLREDAFASIRINWDRKDVNIRSISEELSLGLDSFIFIDDNPAERQLARLYLPEVFTPDLPNDPADFTSWISSTASLWITDLSAEDQSRNKSYINNKKRTTLKDSADNYSDYLASLNTEIEIKKLDKGSVNRVHQLINKTNQFNLSTKRYSLPEVESWLSESSAFYCYRINIKDRFEDYGTVGLVVFRIEPDCIVIDTFLLSCRVLGRQVEHVLLSELIKQASNCHAKVLQAHYIPTAKNQIVRSLFMSGRYRIEEFDQPDGSIIYKIICDKDTFPLHAKVSGIFFSDP